jgi:hypothetical protein
VSGRSASEDARLASALAADDLRPRGRRRAPVEEIVAAATMPREEWLAQEAAREAQEAAGGPEAPATPPAPVEAVPDAQEAAQAPVTYPTGPLPFREDPVVEVVDPGVAAGRAVLADHRARVEAGEVEESALDGPTGGLVDTAALVRSIRRRGPYPPGGAKRTVNLDLPADVVEDLARFTQRNGVNRTQVVRRLVEELLAGVRR